MIVTSSGDFLGIFIDCMYMLCNYEHMKIDRRVGRKPVNAYNLVGKRFGRLLVLKEDGKFGTNLGWMCQCDCGALVRVRGVSMVRGITKSCGCLHREKMSALKRTHGMSRSPEHQAWNHAIQRCSNKKTHNYPQYGGRGITVCQRWMEGEGGLSGFHCFLNDMGLRPSPKHSIHRVDNDGNYEPGNCVWATQRQQSSERQNTIRLEFNGITKTLLDWSSEVGLPYKELHRRIFSRGWQVNKAFTTPVGKLKGTIQ